MEKRNFRKRRLSLSLLTSAMVLALCGQSLAIPDGILVSGGPAPQLSDALQALRIAVNLVPPSAEYLEHGDVAPVVNDNPVGNGRIDVGDALVILKKVVGLSGWNIGSPLKVADKVSVVDAKDETAQVQSARMGILSVPVTELPSTSPYKTDPTFVYVNERSGEAFRTVNEILCMISQAKYDAMLNRGPYKALINRNLCAGNDGMESAVSSQQGGTSASSAPDYETWTIEATRKDDTSPQEVKVWVHEKERSEGDFTEPEKLIKAKMTITEGATPENPYGLFSIYFAGYPAVDGVPTGDMGFQGLLKAERDPDGQVRLKFTEKGNEDEGEFNEAATLVKSADGKSGSGTVYEVEDEPEGVKTLKFDFAFNETNFLREATDISGNSSSVCLDRVNFETSAWRYGLYDSDNGGRINLSSGFPFKYETTGKIIHGWIGYWGLGLPLGVTIPDNATVYRQTYGRDGVTEDAYTVIVKGGKLKKHTRHTTTLGNIKNIPLEGYMEQVPGSGPPQYVNFRVIWNGVSLVKTATSAQNMDGPPAWTELNPPQEIDYSSLPYNELNFWSQALGGQVRVKLSCDFTGDGMTCNAPNGSSEVVYFTEDITYPGESIPALACYDNCPKADIANNRLDPAGYGFGQDGPNAAPREYEFQEMILHEKGSNVPLTLTVPNVGQQWGYHSGPLFDSALIADPNNSPLACDWTDAQGNKTICGWKAWSNLDEFYTWETGPNNWNQLSAVMKDGNVGKFDRPLRVEYTHSQPDLSRPDAKYDGTSFSLDYNGFGELHGIPGKCFDMETGETKADCNGGMIRWVPEFTIAKDSTVKISKDGTDMIYYVKPLEVEQRLRKVDVGCETLTAISYDLPTINDWQDPAIGDEPDVNNAPAVIGGVVQQ